MARTLTTKEEQRRMPFKWPDRHRIHDHIVDLMVPFQKKQYYTRFMQGSYSIKYVLPALFLDDPELDLSQSGGRLQWL